MISTNQYSNKLKDNRTSERISAGKKGIYYRTDFILGGESLTFKYDDVTRLGTTLKDINDGCVSGKIECVAYGDIDLQFNLHKPGTTPKTSPTIILKPGESFDIGQFNGTVYSFTITNSGGGLAFYTINIQ